MSLRTAVEGTDGVIGEAVCASEGGEGVTVELALAAPFGAYPQVAAIVLQQ
ncbi:MAG: hypothetical protein VCF24_21255 [Candidatus Latescibacterota bacterium]